MIPAMTALADDGKPNLNAAKAPAEVVIDGLLDKWSLDSVAEMSQQEQLVKDNWAGTGSEDLSAKLSVMWDEGNFYIGGTVIDETPFMLREGFPLDYADSLIIFFATDPSVENENYSWIDRSMLADNKGFETKGGEDDEYCEQVLDGFAFAYTEIEGGFTFEMAISWSNFSNDQIPIFVPIAGVVTAFELGITDLDTVVPGVEDISRMQWAGRSLDVDINPSLWGTITFVE